MTPAEIREERARVLLKEKKRLEQLVPLQH